MTRPAHALEADMTPSRATSPHRLATLLAAVLATVLLAGCTVTITERTSGSTLPAGANDVLQTFEPSGGAGSGYRVGEDISFRVRSRVEGYLTLTSLSPNGDVHVFARNIRVPARRTVTIDGSDRGAVFLTEPPTGVHRVRASFTPRRTDTSRVTFRGRAGEADWSAAIRVDLAPFEVTDWAETRYFVYR